MNLQDIFYIIGIVFMALYTVLLVTVVILLFYIKKRITDMVEKIKDILAHPAFYATKVMRGEKI
jgi:hypothetical protein